MNIELREAVLEFAPGDGDLSRNIKLDINIKGRLPFVSMPQAYGTGVVESDSDDINTIEYNKSFASKISPDIIATRCFNIPVDKDDGNRYMLVSTIGSMLTQDVYWLIYDAKYRDMILIPSLSIIGDSPKTKTNRSNSTIIISGYQVGGNVSCPKDTVIQQIEENLNVPKPPATFITKSHIMSMNGFIDVNIGGVTNTTTFGQKGIELDSQNVVPFASLGPTSVLGGDVSACNVIKTSISSYSLQPGIKASYDDILIPIIL